MPVAITVLYPKAPDATFNLDYYLSTHMPLVQDKFGYGFHLNLSRRSCRLNPTQPPATANERHTARTA